jgi:hypothetical protein
MMRRLVSLARLEAIRDGLEVAVTDEQGRIREGV